MLMSLIKFSGTLIITLFFSGQLYAETNMRIVCLTDANQPDPSELLVIELKENQPWDLSELALVENSFPRVASRDSYALRITHYRNVQRRNRQSLHELAQAVSPSQRLGEPMFIEGTMLGPVLTFSTRAPYLNAEDGMLSQDRRFIRLSYAIQPDEEDYPAVLGFRRGRFGSFSQNQARCSPPHFYTVGGEGSFVPPADGGATGSGTALPATK